MTIPPDTPMDDDRRAMRDASEHLADVSARINNETSNSVVLWGMDTHNARVLAASLRATVVELEGHLAELYALKDEVSG